MGGGRGNVALSYEYVCPKCPHTYMASFVLLCIKPDAARTTFCGDSYTGKRWFHKINGRPSHCCARRAFSQNPEYFPDVYSVRCGILYVWERVLRGWWLVMGYHSGPKCKDRLILIFISTQSLYFRPQGGTQLLIKQQRCTYSFEFVDTNV